MSTAQGRFPYANGLPVFPTYTADGMTFQDDGSSGYLIDGQPHNLVDGLPGHGAVSMVDDTLLPDWAILEISGPHDTIAAWMALVDGNDNPVYFLTWVDENAP